MSPARKVIAQQVDWLALVEPSGPFLTVPVLRRVFPSGLERTPAALRSELRERVESLSGGDMASRRQFVEWVLSSLLEFGPALRSGQAVPDTLTVVLPEHGVVLRPEWVVARPDAGAADGRIRLLVSLQPPDQPFTAPLPHDRWSASPVDRMAHHCRSTGVELGLITDGDRFMLVWAPRSGPLGRATWQASVFSEAAERTLLDSFTSLLGARRLFGVEPEDTLEALLAESAGAQSEVTNQLGRQVRQAVELLVGALSRADRTSPTHPLAGLDPHTVYEAACTVMMRLVFLLYAEERLLLPLGDELYDRSYAASTLRQALQDSVDRAGSEEALEHESTAWPRLLALFRAVHGGLSHDQLRLPAYGGRLFDPDRFAFLEGRRSGEGWQGHAAEPIPVDDRTVLALLTALQVLQMRQGGVTEARRLSFRSLAVEQIGYVYEGLLDHGVEHAREPVAGLIGRPGYEPEVPLSTLDERAADGPARLVSWLAEATKRSEGQISTLLSRPPEDDRSRRLLAACDNDQGLYRRVEPYSLVLRDDIRDLPMVIPAGALYVTETSHRRDTGTQYTGPELSEEIARYTLEPLVYSPGPAEGADPAEWKLRGSKEILALRVCDPAVGSGAILVAACRYLADRLVEAWRLEGAASEITGRVAAGAAGEIEDEVVIAARRAVAERCLYGVDRDPMATEMAKLSLWLTTLSKERPFTFLDHALRAGDSLLGITSFEQLETFHLDPDRGRQVHFDLFNYRLAIAPHIRRAIELRQRIEDTGVRTVRDAEEKGRLLREADAAMRSAWLVADVVAGAAISTAEKGRAEMDSRLGDIGPTVAQILDPGVDSDRREEVLAVVEDQADAWLNAGRPAPAPHRRCLHWPLAFPEIFDRAGGFDAVVGNPPFLGGKRISGPNGTDYREYLVRHVAGGTKGNADLVAYFFLRAAQVARRFGFLATNTIAQGDTREVALDELTTRGWTITRAVKSTPWPGEAMLEIAKVWMAEDGWKSMADLDDLPVVRITPSLDPGTRAVGSPHRLAANSQQSFQGSIVLGMGFIMSPEEARRLIDSDPRNAEVLFPYLNGEDLNSSPSQRPSRFVINFRNWSLDRSEDYPQCLARVRERVKPKRDLLPDYKRRVREAWWRYEHIAPTLYNAIDRFQRVLTIALTSKLVQPTFVASGQVFSNALAVFAYDDEFHFGILTSAFHWHWTIRHMSTFGIGNAPRYTPTDCFETFPQPPYDAAIAAAGKALDDHRGPLMIANDEGLTKTYNRVHDNGDGSPGIERLRELHMELDGAVAHAYGWSDVDLDHGFHETSQGVRFTIGPAARVEILDRLLELNQQRYAEEVARGLHAQSRSSRTPSRARGRKRAGGGQTPVLFEDPG